MVFWLRRLLAPLISAGAGLAISYFGLPPDVVGIFAGAPGQAVGALLSSERTREAVHDVALARPGAQPCPSGHEASQRGRRERDGGVDVRLRVTEATRSAVHRLDTGMWSQRARARSVHRKRRPTLVNHGHRW